MVPNISEWRYQLFHLRRHANTKKASVLDDRLLGTPLDWRKSLCVHGGLRSMLLKAVLSACIYDAGFHACGKAVAPLQFCYM